MLELQRDYVYDRSFPMCSMIEERVSSVCRVDETSLKKIAASFKSVNSYICVIFNG